MAKDNLFSKIIYRTFRKALSVPENPSLVLENPRKFLIVRQHNQLGDLLIGVSLFRAIKEKYPQSSITLIVSPFNYPGLVKNRFLDRVFIFDKKKLLHLSYLNQLKSILREEYDVAIVPAIVSVSFTSNLLARFANAKTRIGPDSLDGIYNKSSFLFDRRVVLDWRKHPDSNVAERNLDIVRPFGINTENFSSEISFDSVDLSEVKAFLNEIGLNKGELLIGLHAGAGKIQNRWSLLKYITLIQKLNGAYKAKFFLTGSMADSEELQYIKENVRIPVYLCMNKPIPVVAALISMSQLFICNDTGIMHVAGATGVPQISLFGPTNPFNWAPIGSNKHFIRNSELIDDISADEVFDLCKSILSGKTNGESLA
ncbi:MAG TPA: glycosyltransferase family 9 protein [Ignavibacteriaceae bacterium]|nr:glycosyltransferase family 9 protein [Ignavibacteriaceae bacterium]